MIRHALKDGLLWGLWQQWLSPKERTDYSLGKLSHLPRALKAKVIVEHARAYSLDTFVETGTWVGLMIRTLQNDFKGIYSVELDPTLVARARRRFRNSPHITIHQGDSATILPLILDELKGQALFWLDAHYSGQGEGRLCDPSP